MKHILGSCLFFSSWMFLWSCSPLNVTSDYDRAASFQQYKTFMLDKVDAEKQSISQLNLDRISNAVRAEMVAKNFQESSSPDLIIHTAAILKDKKSVDATTNFYGYGGSYRPYAWGSGMGAAGYTTYNVQNYKDGSLIIDIVDAKTQKLLWEGVGNKEIDAPLKDPDKEISAAVAAIMARFPPGASK